MYGEAEGCLVAVDALRQTKDNQAAPALHRDPRIRRNPSTWKERPTTMPERFTRRRFLEAAAAGGALLAGGCALRPLAAAEEAGWPQMPPVKIHVVYVGLGGA